MDSNNLSVPSGYIQQRAQKQRPQLSSQTSPSVSASKLASLSSASASLPTSTPAPAPTLSSAQRTLALPASFPAINSTQRVGARKKVVLAQGCSPLDWARLNSSGKNMRGIDPMDFPLRVSKKVLEQHRSTEDCWTVLKGKVYNITEYIRFHPGGVDEIMKCAGRDGTLLFMKYHAWVNYERMLENCLVGTYVG